MANIPLGIRPPWGMVSGMRAMPKYLPLPRYPIMQIPPPVSGTVGMAEGGRNGRRIKVCPHCKGCGLVEDDEGINVNPKEEGLETGRQVDEDELGSKEEGLETGRQVDEDELGRNTGEENEEDERDTSMQEDSEREGEERKEKSENVHGVQPSAKTFVPVVQGGVDTFPFTHPMYDRGVFRPPRRPPRPKQPSLRLLAPRPSPGVNQTDVNTTEEPPPPSQSNSRPLAPRPEEIQVEKVKKKKGVSLMCEVCQYESTFQSVMDRHVATHTINATDFMCTHGRCRQRFASEEQLEKHLEKHKTYACASEGCGYVTSRRNEFIVHERKHTGEKPFTCEHPGCGGRFVSLSSLQFHTRNMHSDLPIERKRPLACTYEGCLFRTRGQKMLEDHMRMHTGEKPFPCTFPGCSARFRTTTHQRSHMQRHLGTKKFTCPFEGCTYGSIDKVSRDAHLTTHTGEKPFECKECGARFLYASSLRMHVKAHRKG